MGTVHAPSLPQEMIDPSSHVLPCASVGMTPVSDSISIYANGAGYIYRTYTT